MGLKKNLVLMGGTTFFRLSAGIITFSIVARILGPADFGLLMFWYSVSALLCMLISYGLVPLVLREIGIQPENARTLIAQGLSAMLLLTFIVAGVALVIQWVRESEHMFLFGLLLVASLADAFAEYFNSAFRASNRFDVETRIATLGAFTHATIVIGLVFYFKDLDTAAMAYALSRLLILTLTLMGVRRFFSAITIAPLRDGLALLRRASSYAIDAWNQGLFGQIDSLVLNHYLGPVSVGLYQAGMRLFQGGTQASRVLSQVFLPRAAAASKLPARLEKEAWNLQFSYLALGFVGALLLITLSSPIVHFLYGPDYEALVDILPLFGVMFYLRMTVSVPGILLTAVGKQKFRTFAGLLNWAFVACLAAFLVPAYGVAGWIYTLLLGNGFLIGMYSIRALRYTGQPLRFTALSASGLSLLVFLLYYLNHW
jgi:O-antigen/teichoic acid export membrane protein